MIKKISATPYGVVEYTVSTEDEVAQLPHLVGQGSVCIVIETANVYMFSEEDLSWHSLVDNTVVKPITAYNKPKITSFTMTPSNPALGETVSFSYQASYDNSSFVEEKWINKQPTYSVGKHEVGVQVKDARGKWSDVYYHTFEIKASKAPVISNFRIEPSNPVVGQNIAYFYDVEFENERITKRDEWFSNGKKTSFNTPGIQKVQLKIKDTRNIWSEAVSLEFNVTTASKKTTSKEDHEIITVERG